MWKGVNGFVGRVGGKGGRLPVYSVYTGGFEWVFIYVHVWDVHVWV